MKYLNKNLIFILFLGLIIFILIVIISIFSNKKSSIEKVEPAPTPTPVQITLPTSQIIPTEFIEQHKSDTNFANEREKILKERPWIIKLSLKAYNYFITYNPEKEEIIITLYFYDQNEREKQLSQAKKDALNTLREIGVNLNKEKVVFIEVAK